MVPFFRMRARPIAGDQNGPIFEGWTLLSALAAQTERLRLGLLASTAHHPRPAGPALPRRRRAVGGRRDHREVGLT
jgi:alkanesulfonate monooxygenase SsuD/methylene tetrahydromethanopterin reductase-like flavin-dependent oxidoreductase (luciferase family)